jgi:glycosyltransferase involved in cell wall biosynthesis
MKIWLISAFEPTPYDKSFSARFISIAEECLKRGHSVHFFSSTFKHSTKEQRFNETKELKIEEGYRLTFIKTDSYKKNISFERLKSHRKLSFSLMDEIQKQPEKPDAIFMAYPPIETALKVSKWANKNRIPFLIDIIDPWPDDFRKVMKAIPKKVQDLLLSGFTSKTKKILNNADGITGIAKARLEWAKQYCTTEKEMGYFYPSADLQAVQEKLGNIGKNIGKGSKLRVIYAGSFASSYDLPTIIGAANILNEKYSDDIEFVLAGAGPQENIVREYVKSHENMNYVGRISKEELMKEYYLADLGLIQHFPGATQTVTYKLFDLMSCGIPILNSLESELNDIVIENKVGLFNESGDSRQLADNILYCLNNPDELNRMKERAIKVTSEIGDTTKVYSRVVELIEKVASQKKHCQNQSYSCNI